LSDGERHRRILEAFQQADERLQACATKRGQTLEGTPASSKGSSSSTPSSSTPLQDLQADWLKLRPQLRRSSRRSDLGDQAMDLVFRIEQETQAECGAPQGFDLALLLIGNDRQGAER
jgi:hypothetical protein